MHAIRLVLTACLLALLASCSTPVIKSSSAKKKKHTAARDTKPRTPKPITYQGRVLTGITEYYQPGSHTNTALTVAPGKKGPGSWFKRNRNPNSNNTASSTTSRNSPYEKPHWWQGFGSSSPTSTGSAPGSTQPPMFANPDGTTSRVVGNRLVRSDGTTGDMIGNTVYHPNGTKSRIVGNVIYNADGTTSRKITPQ